MNRQARQSGGIVVAIDGPAASGKSTLGRALADRFGLACLDTGVLYRATAFLVLQRAGDPADPEAAAAAARQVAPSLLGDPRLHAEPATRAAAIVGAIPAVRRALLAWQRDFAARPPPPAPGAILVGRDIGTVVCPDADLKLYVTAEVAIRAERRVKELRACGGAAIYQNVLQDLEERDARDRGRRDAPLSAAADAEIIDTTPLDAEAVVERAAGLVARALTERAHKEKEWL